MRRTVILLSVGYAIAVLALLPIAPRQRPEVTQIVPALGTALVITDLATAFLLAVQFRQDRAVSLLVLACAYLFATWMALLHLLAFPAAVLGPGPLIGGPQTAAWIFQVWHLGVPAMALVAVLVETSTEKRTILPARVPHAIAIAGVIVSLVALATALVTTLGHDRLPSLMAGHRFPILNVTINGGAIVLMLATAAAIWIATRGQSALFVWLSLVLVVFAGGDMLALVGGGRYSVGWYASRLSMLVSCSVLFLVLLGQFARLHRAVVDTLSRELIHLSRLNSMGQTASMLAHEINQPLTAASVYLGGADRVLEKSEAVGRQQAVDILNKVAAQVERAVQIVRRLRFYVEKREPEQTVADMTAVVDEGLTLLGSLRQRATITRRVSRDVPAVLIDKIQIQQVLVNLMRNAIEAMDEVDRPELTVTATRQGPMVLISVADNGPGLARAVADELFKPFVTTKKDGMGVGLSICRIIVDAHGGTIWAEPNPSGGTVFHFTIPVAAAAIAA